MSDKIKQELEEQISFLKVKLDSLKTLLEELELKENIVPTPYANLQLSETFAPMTWKEAMDLPRTLNEKKYLGFDDWYLPSAAELYLLIEAGYSPKFKRVAVKKAYDYKDQTTYAGSCEDSCWSANACKGHDMARKVDFGFHSITQYSVGSTCAVLCIRRVDTKVVEDQIAEPAELECEDDQGNLVV